MFEGAILEWEYGIKPARYFCTMAGSRPVAHPFTGSMSLDQVAKHLKLPVLKGQMPAEGKDLKRAQFTGELLLRYMTYCINDTDVCALIYQALLPHLPVEERDLIDLTMKKFTRPRLRLYRPALEQEKDRLNDEEFSVLAAVSGYGVTKEQLMSNKQFAQVLAQHGVTPPTKVSPTTGKATFAFAKKDPGFVALQTHPSMAIRQLVEARLLVKSTIDASRIKMLLRATEYSPLLPVPLLYYGAHTGRFSGLGGINLQNLRRGGEIRKAIKTPPGYKIVTVDLAAIEARITAELAGQDDLVDLFRNEVDVYSDFASRVYGRPITKADKEERFVGKTCILGLGFGMGPKKFGLTMEAAGVDFDPRECERIVGLYRFTFDGIPALWRKMDGAIRKMLELSGLSYWVMSPAVTVHSRKIGLPNGMFLNYPSLTKTTMGHNAYESFVGPGNSVMKDVWGGALTENIVQALARIILSRAEVRLAKAGLVSVLQVHDELVFMVPSGTVEAVIPVVRRVVTDPVPWMPNLPIACEIGVGDSYGDAK
jgi:DNA polymerase